MSITPDFKQFCRLARQGNLVAVHKEFLADLETPVSAFLKVAAAADSAFLLESVEYGEKVGRYSFIGINFPEYYEVKKDRAYRVVGTKSQFLGTHLDVLELLGTELEKYKLVRTSALPAFSGGFVGFLAYENVVFFEDIQLRPKASSSAYQALFFRTDTFLVFDHVERSIKIVTLCKTTNARSLRRSYEEGMRIIHRLEQKLKAPLPKHAPLKAKKDLKPQANMSRRTFEEKVKRIKRYIRQGDIVQAVFSQRFDLGAIPNDFAVYRALRLINPSPYMFYLKHKDLRLVGSSPEMHVKKVGEWAELRPIAGTRGRGRTEEEDLALEAQLKASQKERAEHLMLVDLGRNDLGKVCRYRTISVKNFARVERYSHVMHLVSDVVGKLKKGEDGLSLLRATFPAGTVTGAPKIRAMQIIDELEGETRGPYAGCLGYISFSGDLDMCITIRTLIVEGRRACVQAGAGIVFDSIPSHEYRETVNKAQAVVQAVRMAGEEK